MAEVEHQAVWTLGAPTWGRALVSDPPLPMTDSVLVSMRVCVFAGCTRLGASSCERPTLSAACPRLGASSFERPLAATPDLFPAVGEDPETDFYESHWSCGTEGDCFLNNEDMLPSKKKIRENTDNPPSSHEAVTPVRIRLRKKHPPKSSASHKTITSQ